MSAVPILSGLQCVIADDSLLLREGLASLLKRMGAQIIAEFEDADSLRHYLKSLADSEDFPDIVIADVRMPPTRHTDGLEVIIEAKRAYPRLSVMVLSQYVAAAYAHQLFSLPTEAHGGGSGYLLKERIGNVEQFLSSIQLVASGGVVIDPEVTTAMIRSGRSGLTHLTEREFEVLQMMARGLSNREIAAQLVISDAAVAKHVSNIFTKLHLDPTEDNRRVRAILTYLSDRTDSL